MTLSELNLNLFLKNCFWSLARDSRESTELHLECIFSSKTYYAMRGSYHLGNSADWGLVSKSSRCSVAFGVKKTWIHGVLWIIENPWAKENPFQASLELIDISVNHGGRKARLTKVRKQPVMAIWKHQRFPRRIIQQHVLMKVTKQLKAQASILRFPQRGIKQHVLMKVTKQPKAQASILRCHR